MSVDYLRTNCLARVPWKDTMPSFTRNEKYYSAVINYDSRSGSFTSQDCCSDKEAAHEAVVDYCEWVATKLVW